METYRALLTLLQTLSNVGEAKIAELKDTRRPTWAVTYEGRVRSGQGYSDICSVHIFAGPAYASGTELAIAAAVELVCDKLLESDYILGDAVREPEEQLAKMPFAHLSIEVSEAA